MTIEEIYQDGIIVECTPIQLQRLYERLNVPNYAALYPVTFNKLERVNGVWYTDESDSPEKLSYKPTVINFDQIEL